MPKEFKIAKEISLDASPDQVWESIATAAGLATWSTFSAVDPSSDLVVAWEPGRHLATRTPVAEDGSLHAFEYLIEARDGGSTVLRFVHSGFTGDDWSDEYQPITAGGWDMYLHTLAEYHSHFSARGALLVVAEGPTSSATAEAWARLAGALGTPLPAALGAPVRVELPQTGMLTGVIDYATENFLGLRTPDDLVRFHGRWGLGMTVAVSHHAFGQPFDADAAAGAWKEWLDQALAAVPARGS